MSTQQPVFNNHLALVVDDDIVARTVAIRTMSKLGFEVISADDGDTALEQLKDHNPDIVLLDVEMERMNGIETCMQIRQSTSFGNKPIIMMTSHDNAESIDNAFKAGATDFAVKPVNWTLLHHKIKYVMRSQEILIELSNAEEISALGHWRQSAEGSEISISHGLRTLLGLTADDQTQLMHFVHPADRETLARELQQLSDNKKMSMTHRMITSKNQEIIVQHNAQSLTNFNGEFIGTLSSIQDITEKEKINARVQQLAYYDPLTRHFNRAALVDRLNILTNSASTTHQSFALLHVDIDNFKRINDSLGPVVGDKLLRSIAKRLSDIFSKLGYEIPTHYLDAGNVNERSNLNMLARLGADEFAIILVDDWNSANIEQVCRKLVQELGNQYHIDIRKLTISVSIGTVVYPKHGDNAEILSQNADTAMHSIKALGKNDYKVYDANLSDVAQQKMCLEEHLRMALDNNEFTLFYQPQIDLRSLNVVGAEALLRWNSEKIGQVSPADFIPLAEEIGLIVPIGNWVLKTACDQLASWNRQNINMRRLAINISIRQFNQEDFVEQVSNTIEESGINSEDLELEITESLLAVDVPSAIKKLEELKDIGVDISVDDFGTGYSSLSYLKKFPIDRLKIDQSFVRDIDHDVSDVAITRSIIGLARGLSLSVIAEGVETNEHLAKLTELGCDEAQGYLIGKPIPNEQFVEWLQNYEALLKSNVVIKAA